MCESSTIEVDPDELSKEVAEELLDEGNMSQDDINELKDRVWFDEVHDERPNKLGFTSSVRSKLGSFKDYSKKLAGSFARVFRWVGSSVSSIAGYDFMSRWQEKTVFGVVSDVNRTHSDEIQICVKHPTAGRESFFMDVNATELANLMDYHSVDNAMDLVGESVVFTSETLYEPPSYVNMLDRRSVNDESGKLLVPNNTSILGSLRFKIYSIIDDFRQRTRLKLAFWRGDLYFFGLICGFAVGVFPSIFGYHFVFEEDSILMALIGSLLLAPVVLGVLFYSVLFLYWGYWLFISILAWIAKGSFFEVE